MLEPREADIPILFLVLVVLPLVAYILLGKWSDSAKKKERISLLAQLAAEEALKAEAMVVAEVVPLVASSKNGTHQCVRCSGRATTRCSRCKSVRYCSGKCQIIHWRQVHRQECHPLDITWNNSSPRSGLMEDNLDDLMYNSMSTGSSASVSCSSIDASQVSAPERKSKEKRASRKLSRGISRKDDGCKYDFLDEVSGNVTDCPSSFNSCPRKEAFVRHKASTNGSLGSEGETTGRSSSFNCMNGYINGYSGSTHKIEGTSKSASQQENLSNTRENHGSFFSSSEHEFSSSERSPCTVRGGSNFFETSIAQTMESDCQPKVTTRGSVKAERASLSFESGVPKPPNSTEASTMQCFGSERREQVTGAIAAEGTSTFANAGITKMTGVRKSPKLTRWDASEDNGERQKKSKMLFPYEEFVRFFQYEVFNLSPRGLINCGNSCYANAVLQCLTCTKPLTIYLLHKDHSRACFGKDWCLLCELEQHVTMLRESGAPLSPSRILVHMRSLNRHIGEGSQEDAHEFLRLLVASMQSICLEGVGGEKKVDPRLQETTFIQYTFGGRLRSKVKCLRCHHESERYENIMDLTLEIYGPVESLEDALTQFTTPEDLDGENMYRCGRCAAYVRARKQLSIHEAPNILTIVLKRFQEGRYGKITKCITFPEMLDMIPYMTGKGDMPPLYMLYAVVVHLDTQNASFSGHYVSYVRNLRGNWFRIDDTEVQPVPMSHVMSEGAYILFYMRSCPRPHKSLSGKAVREPGFASERNCVLRSQKSSRQAETKQGSQFDVHETSLDPRPPYIAAGTSKRASLGITQFSENGRPLIENYNETLGTEFSDATSSDWSLFTSSDEAASFTTESTRDSFSTGDYADMCNVDPMSSIFSNLYGSEYPPPNAVSCRLFLNNGAQTRFVSEEKGYVLDSYLSTQEPGRVQKGERSKQRVNPPSGSPSDRNCNVHINNGRYPKRVAARTSSHCISSS
ncbi:ubiquitin carboxyl-terminal hydrolase 15 isoform X2 [Rhodamnia argentea]|uniref:Ubiquitin carboxyl-terminal hydrolase 15 isoform X2 n=1 Tax=Rhodamnia argentea TaxID=178133 RepID=A0A8B8NRQ9_9MYRT|nr:ubiquitin carboxyl-terminal hydrolase 15 isoform X2 [Rhodamnia argentea]